MNPRTEKLTSALRPLLAAAILVPLSARAEEEPEQTLPRFPAVEPEDAMTTFEFAPGFRMELLAAEPLVHDPVAMAFDENLRLHVVEMRGYSEQREDRLGAIRVLTDEDGDGVYDRSDVLVDGLPWPTAIACWKGGVYVAAPPDLWYFKDTDGDRKADVKRRVLTGFSHENVQAMVNSFRWGLDNRIHAATSSGGIELKAPGGDEDPLELRIRDFAFDPETGEYSVTTEGGQHGMGFDDWGRKFSCSNSDHLKQVLYEERYLSRNPNFRAPDSRLSISAEGRQPEVYRISPVEPWRELRTRMRLEGKLMQFRLEGGGRAAGYFTAATGITIYRGDAWPKEFRGLAVVGDVGSNLVHRNRLEPDGVPFLGRRMDEESEFVRSSDTWFRPVQFANGPDGNLYVADMYREIIEHPWSFGDSIKPMLDLTSGNDRGRIYRIVHEDGETRRPDPLGGKSSEELAGLLAHPNAWQRETASRLLHERQDASAAPAIRTVAADSTSALGRLHALYALQGLGKLQAADVLAALEDPHSGVRTHALRLAERLANDRPEVRDRVLAMTDEPDPGTRFQLAFTLGEVESEARIGALTALARVDGGDPWVRMALLTSLNDGADQVLSGLLGDSAFRKNPDAPQLLRELAQLIARKNDPAEFDVLLATLAALPEDDPHKLELPLVLGLREGVRTGAARFQQLVSGEESSPGARRFRAVLDQALAIATDPEQSRSARLDAISLAGMLPFEKTGKPLTALLGGATPETLQKRVVEVLGKYRVDGLTARVVELFPRLTPAIRTAAMDALFSRRDRYGPILDAVERGDLNPGDLNAIQIQRLCLSPNEDQAARALALLSPNRENDRSKLIGQYQPALSMEGDMERGRALFRAACAVCHRAEGFGNVVGPVPATFQNRGGEWMLVNILDPNREVNPEFTNYTVTKKNGSLVAGLITAETATSFTVTRADGQSENILRSEVEELTASKISLMPEGLEATIDQQGMADLLAYLGALK
ncbi:MAG: PVC-type heme-binding CxxCH protein [Verrucomicrobiales bacterium]